MSSFHLKPRCIKLDFRNWSVLSGCLLSDIQYELAMEGLSMVFQRADFALFLSNIAIEELK